MAISTTTYHRSEPLRPRRAGFLFRPGWPLIWLYAAFPLWWLLGLSHFIFLFAAGAMAWELFRRRPVYAPLAFGLWLLFILVVTAGATLLWVQPDGTLPVNGPGKLIIWSYRYLWLIAITVVAMYVINMTEKELPSLRVIRLLGLMFVFTVFGGIAGLLLPSVDFPSLAELVLPIPREGFINTLFHPSLALPSEFLGYEQLRPTAPFSYPNAWGNNVGMFMPFFVVGYVVYAKGWLRAFGIGVLAIAVVPIVFSLNRGLWLGLVMALVLVALKLTVMGHTRVLQWLVIGTVVGGIAFTASPLYDTVTLRGETGHSDNRRETVASTVVDTTLSMSPLLGYGDTRTVSGSFSSIAGGETPDCHQCAAPPLGTQGFMWRLILTTGFLGTALYLLFMCSQLYFFAAARDPVAIVGCLVICMSLVYMFVYDSLESPLFTVMIGIGLMNRRHVADRQLARSVDRAVPL